MEISEPHPQWMGLLLFWVLLFVVFPGKEFQRMVLEEIGNAANRFCCKAP
jgi:hypothetical protein